ncbi:M56 family metallopeptidase [Peribacillus sp. SCS-26]|uniref:M56 family metallopeptidase n=1 Tax=Paraperibacillus marinus TaxID=3115295 RepID=UPI003905C657
MFMVHLLFGVNIQANFFKFCFSLFNEDSLYYFLAIILLNVLISYSVITIVWKAAEQAFLLKKFKRRIHSLMDFGLTEKANKDLRPEHLDILVITDSAPGAFSIGFFRTSIVLSTGLLSLLHEEELRAVVEHESFHGRNKDSLKLFLLQLISQAFFFVPLTGWCYRNYRILSELSADEYAISRMGSGLDLSTALLKLIRSRTSFDAVPAAAFFAKEAVNLRLQQLVEPQKNIPLKLSSTTVAVSVYVLLCLLALTLVTVT